MPLNFKFLNASIYIDNITNFENFKINNQKHMENVYNMEPLLTNHNSFLKYNDNNGGVNQDSKDAYNQLMQTFSHYSYFISHRNLLICDLQGCYDETSNQLILTDPAINCKGGQIFG